LYHPATAKAEYFSLSEFKECAKTLGFTKISRQAGGGPVLPLESWNGVTTEAGSGYSHIGVWYHVSGNTLTVRKAGKPDILYDLS
jgi:hypothetical protein